MDMDRRALLIFNRLRPMYLFKGLTDQQLVEVTRQLERETRAAGETICAEGEAGEFFYIVDRGRVRLTQHGAAREQMADIGDSFGAEMLLNGVHVYTATAMGEVHLLRLGRESFAALVQQHPHVRAGLVQMAETRGWLFSRPWEWLNSGENVYLIVRRHTWLLWQSLFTPLAAVLVAAVLVGVAFTFAGPAAAVWAAILLGGPALLWVAWVYVDWGNDFYLVTNQRVVYVEKVTLIYDSRTTLSMNALTAVGAGTESLADRVLEYGDVTVKTLSKPMVLRAIAYPQIVAALIEEQMNRTRQRARESEVNALKSAIRVRIAPPMAEPKPDKAPGEAGRSGAAPASRGQGFFSLQLRYDIGDTIVYRKHWWILLREIWGASLLILLAAGLVGFGVAGTFGAGALPVVLLVALVLLVPGALWWLYQFQDWRNDLYQVTPDQIVDIYRKPLGRETRDSAALEHIQGLRSERPNFWGRLLNFGNVLATIPGKEFTFDDVYDPPGVQEDIQRRIEAMRERKRRQEAGRQREALAEVLSAYYLATKEVEKNDANQPKGN